MENFHNDCCSSSDQKSFQELVFKAVRNRKHSGYVDCQQVGSIDRNLFLQGGRVTLARGLKDSPGLQAKFTGRVTLLPETTLRLFRFGCFVIKARTDNKTGK